jgi:hypothetical protein
MDPMRRLLGLVAAVVLVVSAGCCLHNTCDCCGDICGSCYGCHNGAYGAPINGHIAPTPAPAPAPTAPMPEPIKAAPAAK